MSSPPIGSVFLCTAALVAAALLGGCAGLSSQEPPAARLAGDWKVDPARSDDLGKAVAQLREQGRKKRKHPEGGGQMGGTSEGGEGGEGPPEGGRRGAGRQGGGGQQGGQQGGESGQGQNGGQGMGMGLGPGPSVAPADELMANVPQGDYLRITANANAFTVTSGDSSDEYTPGVASEISAEQGDAQQISGWKGASYVIDTTPQWGAEVVQTFELTKHGNLKMTVRLTGRGTRFTFTRIYVRTTQAPPLALPTNN